MDDSLVAAHLSARRKKRLLSVSEPHGFEGELKKDVVRLLGCVQSLAADLPAPEREHVDRVLGTELKDLLMDFCFDLSAHMHRDDADNAFRDGGLMAVIDVALNPFEEVIRLFDEAGLRHP